MHIHYLQHVSYEDPGNIICWAEEKGHQISGTHFYRDDKLPTPNSIDALVVMGGPMGVNDEDDYSWLIREKEFIRECIRHNKKVLGICLGAQLIADVMGAKVKSMGYREIGWFSVRWSEEACRHYKLSFLPKKQYVLHWHGDQFDLPEGALPLADSEACPNQGFLIDDRILGLQFHLEMTRKNLRKLIKNSEKELEESAGNHLQNPNEMEEESNFDECRVVMDQLLNNFFV